MPSRAPSICIHCNKAHSEPCAAAMRVVAARKARFDKTRPNAKQRGYNAEWDKARAQFLAVYPSCVICGAKAQVVDHKKPHKGNDALFWDRTNWQSLCTHHHNSFKQAAERRAQGAKP